MLICFTNTKAKKRPPGGVVESGFNSFRLIVIDNGDLYDPID